MYYKEDSIIFYNGKFIKASEATENPYSQSLHYGNGVFEGIRAYNTPNGTRIFKSEAHYKRLKYGAEVMNIQFNYTEEELTKITYELLERNGLKDAYIRPLITTGADMSLVTSNETNLIIQCWEWGKYMGDKLLRVKTSSFQRPNPKACFVEAKVTGHYINSILSTNEAKQNGYDEALLLDMNGNVAECSGANIFMEKDGKLYTPPRGHIMAGITRSTVIELCKEEGVSIEEKHFTLEELKNADACFFTGTAAEVVGLQSLDTYEFPLAWEKSHGYQLMKLYKDEVLGLRQKRKAS
ncbi:MULTISPECIES: branched-chain amino acid transaminase [unclassified Tenacibaculum]|uniref:branched-chain amino acid transaminase n=1 Tax=unclassified Tenacibaculum TaxID=2635139 RepID=UPI001F3CC0E4|nr:MULTISPECIES: branched-chain amino acid transaminase [unclassified Tenacibaculum]MCF2874288.1 branched-chain amino acid transaminase [Tenacibaculum sp. Cn5-1]MCF2934869.1 branched-chain amino acid transaminase [Tenacibaculum sp. Cn5-34]MCG7511079.1 branched-chain amino acid transaminase [Tenacibaculum sp. Cn5-46]